MAQLIEAYGKISAAGAEVLAFFASSPAAVDSLASKFKPPFPLLGDREGVVYDLYGVGRAPLRELYSPRALAKSLKELSRGFLPRRGEGDMRRVPATFIIDKEGIIRFAHRGRHTGDRVEVERLIPLLESEPFPEKG